MQSELREAAYRMWKDEEVIGAVGLIIHLATACFVQRLSNEIIKTIVLSKGETAMLTTFINAALQEESAILSAGDRQGFQY